MASTTRQAPPPRVTPAPQQAPPQEPADRLAIGLLAAVVVAAIATYVVLALQTSIPTLAPDEYRYGHLARGIADGTGFDWRGAPAQQTAALYAYLIAPFWAIWDGTTQAYDASKVAGTVALCLQAVPVWLLARTMVGPRLALVPALLSVAGTWMVASAFTATEVVAYPLATSALCLGVVGLRRRSVRVGLLALLVAGVAAWARLQLVVLIPALLAAQVLQLVGSPRRRWLGLLRGRLPVIALAGAITLVGLLAAVLSPGLAGDYRGLFDFQVSTTEVLGRAGVQLLALVTVAGFVPVLLVAGATCSRRLWRDDDLAALFAVFWPTALLLSLQTGFFIVGVDDSPGMSNERYMTYAVPLALVAMTVLLERRLLTRWMVAVATLLGLALLLQSHAAAFGIEAARYATAQRVDQLTGADPGVAVALAAVAAVVLAGTAYVGLGKRRITRVVSVGAVVLVVLAVQSQPMWHDLLKSQRAGRVFLPNDLEWIDHHAGGPTALLVVTNISPQFATLDYFNRTVTQAYVPDGFDADGVLNGDVCGWRVDATGALDLDAGCGETPRRFFVDDPLAIVTFHDQVSSVGDDRAGAVLTVAAGRPVRLRSVLMRNCPMGSEIVATGCGPNLSLTTWTDAQGTVELRFRGGRRPQHVRLEQRSWTLEPGTETTLKFPVNPAGQQQDLATDWATSDGAPRLEAADLVQGRRRVSLLR